MITPWIAYGLIVSTLLGIAALATEQTLLRYRMPVRYVWFGAAVGGFVLPVAALAWRMFAPVVPGSVGIAIGSPEVVPGGVMPAVQVPELLDAATLARLDTPLLIVWALASIGVIALILGSHLGLRRRRHGWSPAAIEGQEVWISPDLGPAALGFRRPIIVLPAWVDRLDTEAQRLMLLHEREHVAARDPRLLAAGLWMLALAPWNLALWWQIRRLRSAIEIDCDSRVLRRTLDPRAYGTLLLEVSRHSMRPPLAVATLAHPAGQLERRIRMLIDRPESRPWTMSLAGAAVAAAVLLAACEMEPPESVPSVTGAAAGGSDGNGTDGEATSSADPVVVAGGAAGDAGASDPGGASGPAGSSEPAGDGRADDERDSIYAPDDVTPDMIEQRTQPPVRSTAPPPPDAAGRAPTGGDAPSFTPMDERPAMRNASEVSQELQRRYPAMLKDAGVSGTVTLWVELGETGDVLQTRVYDSSGYGEFDRLAQDLLENVADFQPAMNEGEAVRVWIQIPVRFAVAY